MRALVQWFTGRGITIHDSVGAAMEAVWAMWPTCTITGRKDGRIIVRAPHWYLPVAEIEIDTAGRKE